MSGLQRVWIVAGAYALVYAVLDLDRFFTYHSGADLGLFAQTIASSLHGFSNTVEGGSHFLFHFSPILFALAPLLWLSKSPAVLLVVQSCATAVAAPALYLIARRRLPEQLALLAAIVVLLYPPLAGVAFSDFHENAFVVPATLWFLWSLDERRFGFATLFFAVLLATKEDQAVILAVLSAAGMVYFTQRSQRRAVRFSACALLASVAVFVSYFAVVRPLAGGAHPWEPLHFYVATGAPAHSLGHEAFTRLTYLLEAFVPLCFACFLSPVLWLAVPGFAELLLSHDPVTYTMGQHYAAVWIGYVLAAFALGVARVYRLRPRLAVGLVRASLVVCFLNLVFFSPTHWSRYLALRSPHDAELDAVLRRFPAQLEVGTHDELFAHLGLDPNASLGLRHAPAYALIDGGDADSYWVIRMLPQLQAGRSAYERVFVVDGIHLYRRKSADRSDALVR